MMSWPLRRSRRWATREQHAFVRVLGAHLTSGCTHTRPGASSCYYCCLQRTPWSHRLYGRCPHVETFMVTSRVYAWPWQVWHFKPTVEKALAKEKDLLAGAEGPTIAVHLRGGDKRQENADLVRGPRTAVLPACVSSLLKPTTIAAHLHGGCLLQESAD